MEFYPEEQWLTWIDVLAENEYLIIDDFLEKNLLQDIQNFFTERRKEDDFAKASIGTESKVVSEVRGDYTYWLDRKRDTVLEQFYGLVDETMSKLNRYCYLSLSDFEFHLAYYPPGSYYHKHLDQFRERSNRMISFIIYLNEDWEEAHGGQLKIYKEREEMLVEPVMNRAVLFKSATVPHEVLTTTFGRKSLTGWLLYQPTGLGQILT
ncbi:2OG-Fe(II) oxygenase [Jiulongibacter sp. NS-SX5]|uniref:2OG-Fe(II) oxygenase n=1 Tax=Jiulongibacter sp. NS-SX5 TaxID=3463854 RepID=UPI0040595134